MNKKLILILACIFAVFININVKAGCKNNSSASCGSLDCGKSYSSYSGCTGATKDDDGNNCCYWQDPVCGSDYILSNHSCVAKPTCCKDGVTFQPNSASCPSDSWDHECLTPSFSFIGVPERMSDDDSKGISVQTNGTGWNVTMEVTGDTSAVTVTYNKENKITIKANNNSNTCKRIRIKATRAADNYYKEGSAQSSAIVIFPQWSEEKTTVLPYSDDCVSTYNVTKTSANMHGLNYYRIHCKNEGHRCVCDVAKRGCGTGDGESPHCYEDKYGYRYWGRYAGSGYTVVPGVNSELACKNGPTCSTTGPTPSSTTTACNGTGTLTENYEKNCKSPAGKYIYRIVCKDNVTTNFRGPVLDGNLEEVNNAYMAIGTGFKFTFNAKSNLKCTGEFSIEEYNAALKNFKNYRSKKIEDNPNQTDLMMGRAALSSFISEFALSYINWKPNYSLQADATILDYSGNTKMKSEAVNLLTSSSVTGTSAVSKCGNLPVGSADSSSGAVSFTKGPDFKYSEVHEIEKILPVAVLDKKGKIKYVTSESSVGTGETSMGRQFFITDNRDYLNSTNYNYRVEVSKLGFSHQSTDKTKCDIGILNNKVIYRHIDANDPFLQKTKTNRPIGYNWSNSKLNFTKIIHTNVWSHSPDYTKITIDKSTALSIQGATRGNASYYIGACKRGQAKSGDIICTIVRNHRTTGA